MIPLPQMPVSLKGKNIEEIINEWNAELEEQVAAFNKHAGEASGET